MEILEAGVDIATLSPERIHTQESTDDIAGLLEPLVGFARSNDESLAKSSRAKDNWNRKRKENAPHTTKCPSWLKVIDGKFVVLKDKASVIRDIYQWSINGDGARIITKRLNQKGIPNIALGSSKAAKFSWTLNYVELILKTKAVIGTYQPHKSENKKRVTAGDPIANYFPAVISTDDYYQVQANKKARTTQRGRRGKCVANLFTEILFDARTGSPMRLVNWSKRRRLASSHADLGLSEFFSIKYEVFETNFLHFLRREIVPQLTSAKTRNRVPGLQARIEGIAAKIESVQDECIEHPDLKSLIGVLTRLERERDSLLKEIEAEKISASGTRQNLATECESLLDMLDGCPEDQKEQLRAKLKSVIRQIVKEIWILIEDYKTPEGRPVRTCTVQAFLDDERFIQFVIWRERRQFKSMGTAERKRPNGRPQSSIRTVGLHNPLDLRKWRDDPQPTLALPKYLRDSEPSLLPA